MSMTRLDAIEQLKQRTDALKGMGATSLYLYGSTSRDEAKPDSDLDLFIDYDPASRFKRSTWSASSCFSKRSCTFPSM